MLPLTLQRLVSFSHPLLLWDDAARLLDGKENRPGVERVYHNRGLAFFKERQYISALNDFNKALEIWPQYSFVYNDRGAVYLEMQDYQKALEDFNRSILLKPDYFRPYLGRARVFELQAKPELARDDYIKACTLGLTAACTR
ncbi:lipoprotein NlpI [Iodobacter fluviatilis]|nr:tetratricopeptide repeat protein [Iodobacter fluviatilis]STR45761.1 lipoprotein NlpI [Iodobacter fluviatilis]